MPFALLIGVGAGLVSGLLFASASTGTLLGLMVLVFLTPLPVAIAGLGWGWPSAATAAVTAPVIIAVVLAPRAALLHLIALGLPTVILSYLTLLNRAVTEDGQERIEWYPIGRIVSITAVLAGVIATIALLTTATDIEGLRATLRETFERGILQQIETAQPGDQTLGENEIATFTELMVVSFAGAIATMWMAVAILNLWLAGVVTRASGLLVRPWPAFSMLTLPRQMAIGFAAAVALTFLPGYPGLIASGFASAFIFAYLLVGLAILHYVTQGMAARPLILFAVYASLVFLNPFSGLAVAMIGLAEPISPLKRKLPPGPPLS